MLDIGVWTTGFGSAALTTGGAVDISFDPAVLSFVSWTDTSGSLWGDQPFVDVPGVIRSITIDQGWFDVLPEGDLQSGFITFSIVSGAPVGNSLITMAENLVGVGGFFSEVAVNYSGAMISIVPSGISIVPSVPVPATLMLFFSALGSLGLLKRKARAAG